MEQFWFVTKAEDYGGPTIKGSGHYLNRFKALELAYVALARSLI